MLKGLATPKVLEREEKDIEVQKDLASKLEEEIGRGAAIKNELDTQLSANSRDQNECLKSLKNADLGEEQKRELEARFKELQDESAKLINESDKIPKWDRAELYLGTIELQHIPSEVEPEAVLKEAMRHAELVPIKPGRQEPEITDRPHSIAQTGYDIVEKIPGSANLIIENTLRTMIVAEQFSYLREAAFVGKDKGWKLWIEVHYVRDRNPVPSGLHKDTQGQTLFVNLNYQNEGPILGPEYLLNPALVAAHEDQVKEEGRLPAEFRNDLAKVRTALGPSDRIEAPVIPHSYGAVAFVDEAIHHMTPVREHRSVTGKALGEFLESKYPTYFTDAQQAYTDHGAQSITWWSYASYLKKVPKVDGPRWLTWMTLVSEPDRRLTRLTLRDAEMKDPEIDEVMTAKGTEGFRSVSIPKVNGRQPVKHPDHGPLKRTMSTRLLGKDLPEPPKAKRAFFRTWVRAVPLRTT
jgi:hypothetical protein